MALVTVAAPARADAGKPSWGTGDYWVYSVSGVNYLLSGTGSVRMDVIGIDTQSVGGVNYEAHHVRLQVNVSGGTFNSGEAWYRTSDLALVKETFNVTTLSVRKPRSVWRSVKNARPIANDPVISMIASAACIASRVPRSRRVATSLSQVRVRIVLAVNCCRPITMDGTIPNASPWKPSTQPFPNTNP